MTLRAGEGALRRHALAQAPSLAEGWDHIVVVRTRTSRECPSDFAAARHLGAVSNRQRAKKGETSYGDEKGNTDNG